MATVFEDLCNFTKLKPEPGEDYEEFAHRVHRKVNTMVDADEDLWTELSVSSQDWNNNAVSIFEQRGALFAKGKDIPSELAVPEMEGFEAVGSTRATTEAIETPVQKASPAARRRPGRPPAAETAVVPPAKAKPTSKPGNSGVMPVLGVTIAPETRMVTLEAKVSILENLLLQISGMVNGVLGGSQTAIPQEAISVPKATKVTSKAEPTEKKTRGRQGTLEPKIKEALATKSLTTTELLQYFKIDPAPETSNSFRQRLVLMKKAGIITNKGRGQPWVLTNS